MIPETMLAVAEFIAESPERLASGAALARVAGTPIRPRSARESMSSGDSHARTSGS
jgi:hypothetical protein